MTATLANASAEDRRESDFYPTPPEVTHALCDWLEFGIGTSRVAWEPACGDGAMAEVLKARGWSVAASDIRETGYGIGMRNFLEVPPNPTDFMGCWIVTNPPFNQAEEFIRHALKFTPNVAMLLKSQFWHAASRAKLFGEHPPAAVLPLTWRPDFLNGEKGGAPTMECLWTVWRDQMHRTKPTQYQPLMRPSGTRSLL